MPYQTKDEDGKLNNFAVEPTMYKEVTKTDSEQKNTMMIGIIGGGLVLALVAVTFLVSGGA